MNLFELFVKIGVDDQASKKIENITKQLGTGLKNAAKIGVAAVGAATTGIIALTSAATKNYAEYEQLVGGVETLFKGASKTLQTYAANAYKTAGMSANDYMSTATSFAASLLQSFGDTSEMITEEMAEEMISALDEQVEAFEKATDTQIKLINKQYTENLKLIDEEEYRRIKALDAEIDKLNEEAKAEEAAIKKRQQDERKAQLEFQIQNASTAAKRREAEKELADFVQQIEEEEREQERKNQIEALKDEKDAVKEESDLKRQALKEQHDYELEAYKEARENELKELKKSLEKQEKMILESVGKTASSFSLPAEAYEKAAEATDMAISDMSDNANKFGTDIAFLQEAYQGFSRNQYQLLDNLRLGYSGTKTEMERLIADAAKLDESVQANDLSFGNVVKAIHAVQVEMGIYGTTAKEAGSTISGSFNSMTAAWQNLLTGISDPTQDFDALVNNVVDSVMVFYNNASPVFQKATKGALKLIRELFPKIAKELPTVVNDLLPILGETAIAVVDSFITTISENADSFAKTAIPIVEKLVMGILDLLPKLGDAGFSLVFALVEGLVKNETLSQLIPAVAKVIAQIVKLMHDPETFNQIISAASDLLVEFANGLGTAIPELVSAVVAIVKGIAVSMQDPHNLLEVTGAALQIVIAIAGGLIAAIPELLLSSGELIEALVDSFINTDWIAVGKKIVDGLGKGLSNAWGNIKNWASNAWNSLWGKDDVEVPKYYSSDFGNVNYGSYSSNTPYQSPKGINVIQNIYSQKQTAADLMEEALYAQNRAVYLS